VKTVDTHNPMGGGASKREVRDLRDRVDNLSAQLRITKRENDQRQAELSTAISELWRAQSRTDPLPWETRAQAAAEAEAQANAAASERRVAHRRAEAIAEGTRRAAAIDRESRRMAGYSSMADALEAVAFAERDRLAARAKLTREERQSIDEQLMLRAWKGNGDYGEIRGLLDKGADPNGYQYTDGDYALHTCASRSYLEVTIALLNAGGDVNLRGWSGYTVVARCAAWRATEEIMAVVGASERDSYERFPEAGLMERWRSARRGRSS